MVWLGSVRLGSFCSVLLFVFCRIPHTEFHKFHSSSFQFTVTNDKWMEIKKINSDSQNNQNDPIPRDEGICVLFLLLLLFCLADNYRKFHFCKMMFHCIVHWSVHDYLVVFVLLNQFYYFNIWLTFMCLQLKHIQNDEQWARFTFLGPFIQFLFVNALVNHWFLCYDNDNQLILNIDVSCSWKLFEISNTKV